MRIFDQPPGIGSFETAITLPGFRMHAASPWTAVSLDGPDIRVTTRRRDFHFDHVICATGYAFDLGARPELRNLAPAVTLWRDRYEPIPDEASAELGAYPYLDEGYEFIPRSPDDAWMSRVHAFNPVSFVSMGPHSTSMSGHRHALPRLLRALTRRLLLEQDILGALRAYNEVELVIPTGFSQETANA
jgi:FAD-dependent urate hydroxylase